jgi:hypothetical protein
MTTRRPDLALLPLDLARIALSPVSLEQRAEAVLAVLEGVLPFDAAWLAVRDPELRRHIPVGTSGAAEPLRRGFQAPEADDEVEQLGLNRHRPPMLASELPMPLPESRTWAEHLLPAGFRGGLAAGLFTPGGRHVGFLSLLSGDASRPGPADRELIAAVTRLVAHALDRTRDIAETARIIQGAAAGVVVTRGGVSGPLPGLPGHPLLADGSPVLAAAAAELAASDTYVTFLAPASAAERERFVRVTALDCARPDLDHLAAAVLLSAPGDLLGLTALHLRILGLLVAGTPPVRAALAGELGVCEGTVAAALTLIPDRLEAPDLATAAARAMGSGLRIPPQLVPGG